MGNEQMSRAGMPTQASPDSFSHSHMHRLTELKAVTAFKLKITTVLKLSQVAVSLDGGSLKSHWVCKCGRVSILLCVHVCVCAGLEFVCAMLC